jgi:hypothetical protein
MRSSRLLKQRMRASSSLKREGSRFQGFVIRKGTQKKAEKMTARLKQERNSNSLVKTGCGFQDFSDTEGAHQRRRKDDKCPRGKS